MGRPRLYATSVERKAAWRRRQGMAVRPHYPSAAAKQAAYRARKQQAAQDLAAHECAAIQQALQTRALADQCWELHELIDDWGRDADMPHRVPEGRPFGLLAGASASFYGMAAARVRRHRRALQRLAHVRATRAARVGAPRAADADCARRGAPSPHPKTLGRSCEGTWLWTTGTGREAPWHKSRVSCQAFSRRIVSRQPCLTRAVLEEFCVRGRWRALVSAVCPCGFPRSPALLWPHRPLTAGR